ncbi:hypothetical protein TL16_g01127 [Triparma laevis f. inornata]|uniref:SAM domain-containing protein n=1 Tax=Triparma laevis f. inornata TaxID=1714386 RepID=A0A9W6ZG65_9STRA|nr:hypothetical protein TL16_g01127 [Triparma laevis f. inornata]
MADLPEELLGKQVYLWKISDVIIWITHIKFKQYASNFKSNGIDGTELYELEETDVDGRLGITKKAHKKKLWNNIKKLKYSQASKEAAKAEKKGGKKQELAIEKISNVGRKKIQASGLGVELRVATVEYNFGITCTYCQQEDKVAVIFCPACATGGDFLCEGQVIQSFIRFVVCRKLLIKTCRDTFDRFYSPSERQHYYYNTRTESVQWRKPYCLRSLELKPFMTYDDAAFKIQNMYLVKLAHELVVQKIKEQYEKIYDRTSGHFYYYYTGIEVEDEEEERSTAIVSTNNNSVDSFQNNNNKIGFKIKERIKSFLAIHVQWVKPKNLYSNDCKIVSTEDLAALRIQFAFRTMKAKQFMRVLVRAFFKYCYDPITGKHYYRNTVTGHSMWRKPRMLGKENWDPTDVREWPVNEVAYFFRRMGFKKYGYVDQVRKYQVDGKLLLTFEWEDYNYLGMVQSMHIKQTLLQLHRREWYKTHVDHPEDIARRDRLRRHHNVDAAARLLQRKYRQRYARARIRQFHEIIRVQKAKDAAEKARIEGQDWWPQRIKGVYTGLDPTLKVAYGKRRMVKGVHGWGHYEGSKFIKGPEELNDEHVSRYYTKKLTADATEMKYTGGSVEDAMNNLDASMDHIAFGGGGKKKASKRFN